MVYDYQEPGRIPEKVQEHILSCDCLIAIATRRRPIKGASPEAWACPDWVRDEVALAHAHDKPIAIFCEEGVEIGGLLGTTERRQVFSRDDFLRHIDKIATFLVNLRCHLEAVYRTTEAYMPQLVRHYVHAEEEIRSREELICKCEIVLECVAEQLEAAHHSMELEDTTPGLSIRARTFDFRCKEMPAGIKVEEKVIQNTDFKFLWKILFDPPLKKGQRVRYAFKVINQNYISYSYEELTERIRQGTYKYKEPLCEACNWLMTYPTGEFSHRMTFPEGYEISNCSVDVRVGEAECKADDEVRRIRHGEMFTAEQLIDRWSLALRVPKPLQNHVYYTYYVPPRLA